MKGELTITVPFELEKHDYVNEMWPPAPGEEEVDSYMLSTVMNEVLHRLGTEDIPLIYSSGYFYGNIYISEVTITPTTISKKLQDANY